MSSVAVAGSTWPIEIPLVDQASTQKWKTNPTIAAGDFKRSIVTAAGSVGAWTNLDNLPTVSPAGSESVAIVVSAAETTAAGAGGHINIKGQDASGAEWSDIFIRVEVEAAALSTFNPSTSTVTLAAATHTGAVIPTVTNLTNAPTAGDLTAAMKASINTEADTAITDAALATAANLATVATYIDTEVAAIKAKTDNLPSDPADASDLAALLSAISAYIDTEVAAIKAKTDLIPASPAATGDIPSAASVVAAMMSEVLESSKTFKQATLDMWSTLVGDSTANAADPTQAIYDSPDGTVQVTHTHTSTSRTLA